MVAKIALSTRFTRVGWADAAKAVAAAGNDALLMPDFPNETDADLGNKSKKRLSARISTTTTGVMRVLAELPGARRVLRRRG